MRESLAFDATKRRDMCYDKKGKNSDTGNRTPSCRVRGGNVNRYTISDMSFLSLRNNITRLDYCETRSLCSAFDTRVQLV